VCRSFAFYVETSRGFILSQRRGNPSSKFKNFELPEFL
jgi:hypothetical protein